jgi:uncharacterized protein (DUF1778 family)
MAMAAREARTSNVTFRLTPDEKALLETGVVLAGVPDMTTFVVAPALERAKELTERETSTVLTAESRRLFLSLIENPPAPSERLMRNLSDNRHQLVP